MSPENARAEREQAIADFLADGKGCHVPTDVTAEDPEHVYKTVDEMTEEELEWCSQCIQIIWGDDL